VQPAPLSRALYEALIPTGPLRVPDVPNPGGPVGYRSAALPVVSGSVIKVTDATGDPNYFVALPAGVQLIPETVALIISNANLARQKVLDSDPATIAGLPQAVGFDVSMYPKGPLTLLDKGAEPVTCVLWQKGSGESQSAVTTVSGRRLPIPVGDEARVVTLVSGPDRGAASNVYIGSDAPNFLQVTGVEPDSPRAESLWWVSNSGVRFGVPTQGGDESRTRDALGLTAAPVPAPWSVIRWLPAGPALSYAAAMTQHDTVIPDTPAKVLDKQGG
ncbi:MAG: type VII secretion protein EccB, partial [Rhodocyclaceae bacterium]